MNKFVKWFKKHFIPHEHNKYEPHILRHESVTIFMILIIVVELAFLAQVLIVFDKTKFLAAVLPGVLTNLTNKEREELNLPPLTPNELLNQAAQLKAEDMARNGYFAHTSPDGKSPWYWLGQVGYLYTSAGENLAVNFFESSDVSRAWMNSPTHKANIIKPNYTEIGIGVANGVYQGRHTVFVAQFFGTPLAFASNTETPIIETKTTVPETPKKTEEVKPKPEEIKPEIKPAETITTEIAIQNPVNNETNIKVLGEETKVSLFKLAINKILTSPLHYLRFVYIGIAFLFIVALALMLFIKSEMQHPKMIVRSLALLSVIIFLLFLNVEVLHVDTIVPITDISANTIAK